MLHQIGDWSLSSLIRLYTCRSPTVVPQTIRHVVSNWLSEPRLLMLWCTYRLLPVAPLHCQACCLKLIIGVQVLASVVYLLAATNCPHDYPITLYPHQTPQTVVPSLHQPPQIVAPSTCPIIFYHHLPLQTIVPSITVSCPFECPSHSTSPNHCGQLSL